MALRFAIQRVTKLTQHTTTKGFTLAIQPGLAVSPAIRITYTVGEGKSMREIGQGFLRIVTNWRLLILILIITGFWMVRNSLCKYMPDHQSYFGEDR